MSAEPDRSSGQLQAQLLEARLCHPCDSGRRTVAVIVGFRYCLLTEHGEGDNVTAVATRDLRRDA
jgi:hypothetical protein